MKKLLIVLTLLSATVIASAKQYVACYRYPFSLNFANNAKTDLDNLISQGYKVISFSLVYDIKCMLVVYDDER